MEATIMNLDAGPGKRGFMVYLSPGYITVDIWEDWDKYIFMEMASHLMNSICIALRSA